MYVYYPKVGSEIVKFINENPNELDVLQQKVIYILNHRKMSYINKKLTVSIHRN